jgi:ABC-2 type transport system permease protein
MRNFWLVAKHEYRRTVVRRGFVIATLAVPLGLALLVAFGILVEGMGKSNLPIGYVDHAGILESSRYPTPSQINEGVSEHSLARVRAYADEAVGLSALDREEVQALFVLPSNYLETLHTELYYLEDPPSEEAWSDFADLIRINLVATLPEEIQSRVLEGASVTVHDTVSNRDFGESSIINIILPFVATFFFFFATMFAAGYMLGVVANEKENRTMEVMVTSVTPGQLIGGKTAGLLAASLTQLSIYVVAAVIGLKVAAPYIPELQQVTMPWDYLGVMALFFLPSYALVAAVMVAIGGAAGELQQGQQVAGILNLFFMLPVFLLPVIFQNPSHPIVVAFSIFPTTSFLTISLRWGLGTVPLWQIGISWVLLVATAILTVWAAARVFRAGMLRYGQPLSIRGAVAALRGNPSW